MLLLLCCCCCCKRSCLCCAALLLESLSDREARGLLYQGLFSVTTALSLLRTHRASCLRSTCVHAGKSLGVLDGKMCTPTASKDGCTRARAGTNQRQRDPAGVHRHARRTEGGIRRRDCQLCHLHPLEADGIRPVQPGTLRCTLDCTASHPIPPHRKFRTYSFSRIFLCDDNDDGSRAAHTGRDIGNLCAFLASGAADYMTGSVIDCDGGFKVALALPGHSQEKGEWTAPDAKKRKTEE